MKEKLIHAHPISIFFFLYRFLYLLLIPLARGIVSALLGGPSRWMSGAWLDLLIFGWIFFLAYEKWNHFKYYMDEDRFYYTEGIFYKRETWISMERICTLSTQQPLWMQPFGLVALRIDTLALAPDKPDLFMYLRKSEACRLMALRKKAMEAPQDSMKITCRPRILDIIFLSVFTSNSLIGIIFIATFISHAGKLFGRNLYDWLEALLHQIALGLEAVSALFEIAFKLPPIAMGIAAVLLGGWAAAFILTLLQTKNLCITRSKKGIYITGGILTKKEYSLHFKDICFIDIRQSLLTRLFRLYSVFLNATGMGKERSDIKAFIPFSARRRCETQLALLLPEYHASPRQIHPSASSIMKFLLAPLWPCLLIPLGTSVLTGLLPAWEPFLKFSGLMLSFPAYWFLGVRFMDFLSSGVSYEDGYFTLRYSTRYYLHTVVLPRKNIALIHFRQSPLQRGRNKCDLKIFSRSEGRKVHHLRNLLWEDSVRLFGAEDGASKKR